jgi:hypothetical protein
MKYILFTILFFYGATQLIQAVQAAPTTKTVLLYVKKVR